MYNVELPFYELVIENAMVTVNFRGEEKPFVKNLSDAGLAELLEYIKLYRQADYECDDEMRDQYQEDINYLLFEDKAS